MDGGVGRRPVADGARAACLPPGAAHGPVLAGAARKGLRQVSLPTDFTVFTINQARKKYITVLKIYSKLITVFKINEKN